MKVTPLLAIIILSFFVMSGCSKSGNGELIGAKSKGNLKENTPLGMEFIPKGSYILGPSDQEANSANTPTKAVSVEAFWMDATEITNSEYRQFVNWAKESMARKMLGEQYPEFLIAEDKNGNPINPPKINWNEKIEWDNLEYQTAMEDLYLPENERFYGKKEIDTRKLVYEFWWIDLQQAAKKRNRYNFENQKYEGNVYNADGELVPIADRSSFIIHEQVHVYPDTLVWIADFTYSYNEPLANYYFSHPGFYDYPVVGITWEQAKAFCHWRSKLQNDFLESKQKSTVTDYRLPTEAEWEYAARGGRNNTMYPWGNYYSRNSRYDYMANFKPLRGNYVADEGMTAMKVGSFEQNDFCLYDMSGNVAEWTNDAFDEAAYEYIHDLNPSLGYNARPDDPPVMKRKVVRGGSWKDIASNIRTSTRNFEYQDSAKSYIGFRCVRSTFNPSFSNKKYW
nr:SUMF1/EgtB/PvdO family nonheme iron enzyme [uncultured Draconibacterium sp.]